jgi:hypothetical protein
MAPTRPLTHDLFKTFADSFHIEITEVLIYNLAEGIFYAKLICQHNGIEEVEVDARTSDAIALALRFNCPIYTYDFILSSAGILIDDSADSTSTSDPEEPASSLSSVPSTSAGGEFTGKNKEELKEMLKQAIEDEAYEKAGKIRDELAKRP